ncbi:MAG: hypothetical protein EBU90_23050, partial [Proteobacteria bacterium]|nr:hypothetical protein [Pseudomonadota bacterium]
MSSHNIYHLSQEQWDAFNKSMSDIMGIDYIPSKYIPSEIPEVYTEGKSLFEGKNHSIKSRQQISETLKKHKRTAEHIENNRAANRGKKRKPLTEE